MLHSVKKLTAATLLLLVAAFGCKKEDQAPAQQTTAKESAAKENTTTAKTWLAQQRAALIKSGRGAQLADAEKINWDNPISGTDGHTLFIPVATDNQQLGKYLKITKDVNGAITGGNYVYLYPTMQKQANAYLLEGKTISANFNGAILEYGLNNQLLASKVYEKGHVVAGKTSKLISKSSSGKGNTVTGTSTQAKVVCYEYYIQTFVNGQLVSEVYLYTMCYGTADATLEHEEGGSGDGDAAALAYFEQYVQSTSTPAEVAAPATIPQPSPNTFTHTWTVASSLLGEGAWKVTATTRMDWYTKKFYNMNTNAFEYKYDIIYLKTLNTTIISNAIGIKSTWDPASQIPDDIYENNTDRAYGRSHVTGKVRHESLILKIPFTDMSIPPREENIGNYCNTYAK